MEVWLSGLKRHIANVLNHIGSEGSNPSASAQLPYGITVAQQVLVLLVRVRLLLGQLMEFVAERLRRKFVALVYAGSNPVKLPYVRMPEWLKGRSAKPLFTSSSLVPHSTIKASFQQRNAKRSGRALVPENAIRNMYQSMTMPNYDEGFDAIIIVKGGDK